MHVETFIAEAYILKNSSNYWFPIVFMTDKNQFGEKAV